MPELTDLIKKTMLAGVGLALNAKDEVERVASELEQKLELSEKDGKKFLDDLLVRYDDTQKKLEARVEIAVKAFMKKADVVTTDELKGLKKEIRELKHAIADGSETKK
jgi:polyhydroxyalkanoate synthesis regulator phasin